MATVKKFNSTYTLDGPAVTVTGNLNVYGNTTQISTTNTSVTDVILTLNDGEVGNGVGGGSGVSGITVYRGPNVGANVTYPVSLLYDESLDRWVISNKSNVFTAITTTTSGNVISQVYDDKSPVLGANLNTNGYSLFANVGRNVIFSGNIQINNTLAAPTLVANTSILYASTPSGGAAGLYVINSQATNEELVTKRRAFGFSLLL